MSRVASLASLLQHRIRLTLNMKCMKASQHLGFEINMPDVDCCNKWDARYRGGLQRASPVACSHLQHQGIMCVANSPRVAC